jgi:hypothetical protein
MMEEKKVNLYTRTNDFVKQNIDSGYVIRNHDIVKGVTFYSEGKSINTALVVQKIITNPLQVLEPCYYYIIFRQKWSKSWWRDAELDARRSELGINVNAEVFDNAYKNNSRRDVSCLVLATPNSFSYAQFNNLFGMCNKLPIRVKRYKDPKTERDAYAVSKALFDIEDPFL